MSLRDTVEPILLRMPSVERPTGHVPFKRKLMWTAGVLLVYFFLTNIGVFGMAEGGSDLFGQFRSILAGSQGSILQLGIGPIVTASIVLQLLNGSDLLPLDLNDPRDQSIYQGLQKALVFFMVVFTGAPLVFSGTFLPPSQQLAATLGVGILGIQFIMFAQVAVGGVLIMYLDEIVSKWGVGSGIGLFIVAGVSQRLFGGVVSQIIPSYYSLLTEGVSFPLVSGQMLQYLILGQGQLLAIATTLFIFGIVVYTESTRIEIPLSHAQVKGARGKFPVKLIYASVMPLILVRAVQANIQFLGRLLNSQLGGGMPAWLGVYGTQNQPVGGLFYYLAPIQQPGQWMWWAGTVTADPLDIIIRITIDLAFMLVGGAVAAIFWVETTGMGSESQAEQIQQSGMQIPGFRRNTGIMENVMDRYIPYVTVIGGALVGFLAVMANMLGTIGGVTGTGLLLAISITYKLYEEIAEEQYANILRKLPGS